MRPKKHFLRGTLAWLGALGLLLVGFKFTGPSERDPPPLRGFALGVYAHTTDSEIGASLDEVAQTGANTVLLKVAETQDTWTSTVIYPNPSLTLPAGRVEANIRQAHQRGLKVLLMPIVLLNQPRKRTDWRGMIEPTNRTKWFRSYGQFLAKYARIAADEGVEFFSVGSELVSMERDTDAWEERIAEVRSLYGGKLLYSSNWDHLEPSPAWKHLDLLGLSAYFELAGAGESPSHEVLLARWRGFQGKILEWSRTLGKPLVVTEVGYASGREGLRYPWDYTLPGWVDHRQQWKGYKAFLDAWSGVPELAGVFFYEWYGKGGLEDRGYTPRGKPAGVLVQKWMNGG